MKGEKTTRKDFIHRLLALSFGIFCLPKFFVKKENLRDRTQVHITDLPLKAVREPRAVNKNCV